MKRRNVFKVFELWDIRHKKDESGDGCGLLIEDISILPIAERRPALLFDFRRDEVQVMSQSEVRPAFRVKKDFLVYGIVGVIQLISARFLLVITESYPVGDIAGNDVYRVAKVQLLKVSDSNSCNIGECENDLCVADQKFVSSIESLIQRHDFYFSDTFDLSSSAQRTFNKGCSQAGTRVPQIKNCTREFVWNFYLAQQLVSQKVMQTPPTCFLVSIIFLKFFYLCSWTHG